MGRRSRREARAERPQQIEADQKAAQLLRRRRRRLIWLLVIPVLTLALSVSAATLLESRPLTGMAALLGCIAWIAMFTAGLGESIPRRGGQSASGINFGRR